MSGNPVLPKDQRTVNQYFDTSVFSPPALAEQVTDMAGVLRVLALGNTPVTFARGPGLNNTDLTLFKNFKFQEKVNLRFQIEAYNVFNHTQFSGVGTSAQWDQSGAQVQRAGDLAEIAGDLRSGLIPLRAGSDAAELGVVEHVVCFDLETEIDLLPEPEVLEQREVGVVDARTAGECRRRVAQCQHPQNAGHIRDLLRERRRREHRRVEVLIDGALVFRENRVARHHARQPSPPPVISVPKLLVVVAAQGAPAIEQPVFRLAVSRNGDPL